MRLLNFSIGQLQTIQIGSEVVRTGHLKAPVAEPWIITDDGAAGDQRAVHPDKLYAFSREAYDHWGAHLGIDPARWPDGFFGENLTLDTLDEDDLRVGDEFELGAEVRLVVAGARTPCLKLAWRLSQPRTFQRVFALSRRSGVYLGVLETGRVEPGDVLRRVRHDPAMPSVADISAFIANRDPPPLEPLERALACSSLSHTNRLLLGAKLDQSRRAANEAAGAWRGWRSFTIDRVVEENDAVRSVHLRPSGGARLGRPRPGQHVAVRMDVEGGDGGAGERSKSRPLVRYWSLSAHADAPDDYRLSVRRQDGPGSRWLHDATPGTPVQLRAPAGNFVLAEGSYRPVVFVAAGIGITPLLAMLHAQLRRPGAAPAYLIYGARTPADVAFRDELDALARGHASLAVHYVYSRSGDGGRPAARISADLLLGFLHDVHVVMDGRRIALPWFEADIYICGPGELCRTLPAELVARGGNADHIFVELFEAATIAPTDLKRAEVRFARSGRVATWTATADPTLLDLAREAGVAIPADCESGSCLTCKTLVLEGEATLRTSDGATLPCIARPATASIVLDA